MLIAVARTHLQVTTQEVDAAIASMKRKHRTDRNGHAAIAYDLIPKDPLMNVIKNWSRTLETTSGDRVMIFIDKICSYARRRETTTHHVSKMCSRMSCRPSST